MPKGCPRNPHLRERARATFTHSEAEAEISAEAIENFEELLAEGLFQLWLQEKGFKKNGRAH